MSVTAPRNLPGSIDAAPTGGARGGGLSGFPRAARKKKTEASLTRLKWLAIVAPLTFLVLLVLALRGLLHHQLHEFPGVVFLMAGLGAGVSIFSFAIFGVIGRLERRISERNQELEALFAVGRAATSSLNLSELLDKALEAVLDVTSAESAEVWLTTASSELTLERQRGLAAEAFRERTRLRLGEGLPGLAALKRTPVVVHDLGGDLRFLREEVKKLGFQTFCALPLQHRGETVGVLAVAARRPEALSSEAEHRLLEGIGEQLAIAIENSRLHEQVLDGAVLEERERIGRELHDGLAQVLGYINTQTLAIRKLLASGRTAEAEEQLRAMEEAARDVYTDVRASILGLRTSLVSRDGLVPSLRKYLEGYSKLAGAEVGLEVGEGAETLSLAPSTELQLMRIVQEALSNIRKHAKATSATVRLAAEGEALMVEVSDDGQGFDLDRPVRIGWPRFGLQTMRERAHALGGDLELVSSPGRGTRVIVRIPLAREEVADASLAR